MAAKNARFIDWINDGPVKLTLRPGQTLRHRTFRRHDEGFNATEIGWTHEGDRVAYEMHNTGTDCDGRMDYYAAGECRLERLKSGFEEDFGMRYPDWVKTDSSQRDYTAEAMGY